MGRLFWKFCLSYWLALALGFAGVATSLWLYGRFELQRGHSLAVGPPVGFFVGSGASTLRAGGLPVLHTLVADWEAHGKGYLFAVDGHGQELLGRHVPPDALETARRLVETGTSPELASQVRLADGETYVLFVPAAVVPPADWYLLRGQPHSPLIPLVAGLVASLGFGALLAWYVARPIRHLRGAFAALSEGRLETRVAPLIGRRRDEVADLGQDFDRMAQRLQQLITAQRRLLHDVSHELRSPLARLQAAIGLARQSPQKAEPLLERIEREAVRVDELVGELLTLARLEADVGEGGAERLEQTDVIDLIAAVVEDAQFEAQASGRAVRLVAEGSVPANVRAELLHRALENVIRNAVRFTREGSVVEVEAQPAPARDRLLIRVADRGPGVPEGELAAIFEPFYRSTSGAPGAGFGLGLAIARRAVEAHGGRVEARNREGGGLVLEISLPIDHA
jgi:two-component system, OmpR family, sensor kinase